jgi:hypothetical protein
MIRLRGAFFSCGDQESPFLRLSHNGGSPRVGSSIHGGSL